MPILILINKTKYFVFNEFLNYMCNELLLLISLGKRKILD
jgi:hypothetical protein